MVENIKKEYKIIDFIIFTPKKMHYQSYKNGPLASDGEGQSGIRSLRPDWPHLPHGSPTFLNPPDSAEVHYVRAQDESIFCAVDLARQLDFEGSLVSYIEKVFNNLENLRKPIRQGQINITLKVGNISAVNKQ